MYAFSEIRNFRTLTYTFLCVSPSELRCLLDAARLLTVCYRLRYVLWNFWLCNVVWRNTERLLAPEDRQINVHLFRCETHF